MVVVGRALDLDEDRWIEMQLVDLTVVERPWADHVVVFPLLKATIETTSIPPTIRVVLVLGQGPDSGHGELIIKSIAFSSDKT